MDKEQNWDEIREIRKHIEAFGYVRTFEPGDVILEENSRIFSIPFVLRGSLKVTQSDDDYKEILLYYLKPGESCIMSILGGMHRERSKLKAVAEEETEVLFLPNDKIPELTKAYPEWLDYVFRLYHKRFTDLLDVVNAIAFKKMDERLLEFLQKKRSLTGESTFAITHEQIATELGTARTVVSRLLKQMEHNGLVSLGRNKITLV